MLCSYWKTVGLSPGGVMNHHVLQEELSPGGWHCNIRPAYSARMPIGGELLVCEFLSCTLGQIWCLKLLPWFSAQDECWSPGATSGGGQLHSAGEEFRASLEECSSWLGWTDKRRRAGAGGSLGSVPAPGGGPPGGGGGEPQLVGQSLGSVQLQ